MNLEKAKQHYSALVKGSKIKIVVEEWDATFWMKPLQYLSVAGASKVKQAISLDTAEGAAQVIHILATDTANDTGDKFVFGTKADLHDLKFNVSSEVVMQIFAEWVKQSALIGKESIAEIKKP